MDVLLTAEGSDYSRGMVRTGSDEVADEAAWIRRAQRSDRQAFESLYRRHVDKIYDFCGAKNLRRLRDTVLLQGLRCDGAAHGATGGVKKNRLRNGLVMTQMALALVLLIGSGLMFRSFQALRAVDPGFDSEGVGISSTAT